MISLRTGNQGDGAKIFDFPAYWAAVREPFLLRLGGGSFGWRARRGWGILDPSLAAPWHMHPGAQEILYTMEGNLVVEIEGQGMMTVKAGECSIIPADVPHLARNDSNSAAATALVVHSRSAKDKPLVVPVKRAS